MTYVTWLPGCLKQTRLGALALGLITTQPAITSQTQHSSASKGYRPSLTIMHATSHNNNASARTIGPSDVKIHDMERCTVGKTCDSFATRRLCTKTSKSQMPSYQMYSLMVDAAGPEATFFWYLDGKMCVKYECIHICISISHIYICIYTYTQCT